MASSFPSALDVLSNPTGGQIQGLTTPTHSGHHANANDILEALEAKLGIGVSVPAANTVLRGTGAGTTAYGQIASADILANAISQVFFQNSGGALTSGVTGAWLSMSNNLSLTGLTIGSPVLFWYSSTALNSVAAAPLNIGISLDAAGSIVATTYVSAPVAGYYAQLALLGQFTATATTHTLMEVMYVATGSLTRAAGPNILALELKR